MSEVNNVPVNLFGDEFGSNDTTPPVITTPVVADLPDTNVSPFRREIDLGDGSGKQVFEGKTADELIDKLTTAQEHATKKIRELSANKVDAPVRSRVLPETDIQIPKGTELTADELWELQNNFDPQKVLDKLLKSRFGDDVSADTLATQRQQERENKAQLDFLADNKEFVPSPENAKHLLDFLNDGAKNGSNKPLPLTKRNLDYAYQELKADGLFVVAPETQTPAETRIETKPNENEIKPDPVLTKKRSTGVPDIGSRSDVSTESANADIEAEVRKIYANPNVDEARTQMQRLMAKVNKK